MPTTETAPSEAANERLHRAATSYREIPHLTLNERAALAALVRGLHRRYGQDLLRVVLFGSKARGDFGPESDLDVLVAGRLPEAEYWRHWRQINEEAYGVELEHDVVFSFLIQNEEAYGRMRKWNAPIHRNIEREGIELWSLPVTETSGTARQ
jgi:predicted nucleotidyltransferase